VAVPCHFQVINYPVDVVFERTGNNFFIPTYFYLIEDMIMTVINTNIAAVVTANAMRENARTMESTMERLATGKRINSASDDAAGLAIGARMEAQVKGLSQATRNANDAINLLQTVDGAAVEIGDMLQRMRELAVQANNGTNDTNDITNLNKEFAQLATEIDRIADDTKFNGTVLMNTSGGLSKSFTIGADEADVVSITIGDYNLADGASLAASAEAGSVDLTTALTDLQAALGTVSGISVSDTVATINITLADVQAEYGDGNTITAANATNVQIAKALTTAAGASAGFSVASFDGSADGTFGLVEKTDFAGDHLAVTMGNSVALLADTATLTGGTAGSASGVLGKNMTAYGTTTANTIADADIIEHLDDAIVNVSSARADYGSLINRLEHSIDNLNSSVVNTKAAKSAIMDADYASETTELARTQIIAQAATAMLSQANQQAQSVLALLK
jgi:flagellin